MSTIAGTQGNDFLGQSPEADTILGLQGNDSLMGHEGHDCLNGNQGNDKVCGGEGNDTAGGGKDADQMSGEGGNDIVYGQLGGDTGLGGDGDDLVFGNQGDDLLYGNGMTRFMVAKTVIRCGGVKAMTSFMGIAGMTFSMGTWVRIPFPGGDGNDRFFTSTSAGGAALAQADVIADFKDGQDLIEFTGSLAFENLSIVQGTGANAGDTIIEDKVTNLVWAVVRGGPAPL